MDGAGFPRARLAGDGLDAARTLLGARLVREDEHGRRVGRIVEVEAYGGPEDLASHARAGRTARTAAMFGPPGHAYVYLVYGMYDCLNVVTGSEGTAGAVLIRAVAPETGLDAMRAARLAATGRRKSSRTEAGASRTAANVAALPDHRLACGPGLAAAAFGIDTGWTGTDLCASESSLRLEAGEDVPEERVGRGPRIGVAYAGSSWADRPWRLWVLDEPAVSAAR